MDNAFTRNNELRNGKTLWRNVASAIEKVETEIKAKQSEHMMKSLLFAYEIVTTYQS